MSSASAPPTIAGLFETDPAARLTSSDATTAELLTPGRRLAVGRAPWASAPPTRRTEIERDWARRVAEGFETTFDTPIDGGWRSVRVVMSPRLADDGSLTGYVGVVLGDTAPVDDMNRVAHLTPDLVLVVDRNGGLTYANESARRIAGDSRLDRLATAVRDQIPRAVLGVGDVNDWRGEVAFRDGIGDVHHLDCTIVRSEFGGFTAWCRDVTSLVRLNAELAHQATHDPLTSLPNRQLFLRRVAEAIDRARVDGRALAVLYVDIDHLKNVNDSLGHEIGDTFIATVGRRLSSSTRPGDLVGRIGGDEFVVLCEGVGDEVTALDLAERVNGAAGEPVVLHGTRVATGVSVGIAVWKPSEDGGLAHDGALELVRRADTAMYRAKMRGKGRCEMYSDAMRDDARRRIRLGDDLERALAESRLSLVFQPIVAAYSGRIEAAESLLRWNHPTEGVLTPSVFLDLAEESGLIVPIGQWVIGESARTLADWIATGRVDRHFRIHVNVSWHQIVDAEFVDGLNAAVARHGLESANVCIEYRTDALAHDDAIRTLQSLGRLGFPLAIDDFGGGSSALSHLRTCPSRFVKFDGSFVRSLGADQHDDPMVRGVIQLVHGLDMTAIATWVGSTEQLERLRALGCDQVQGFHLARPTSAEDFDASANIVR